MATAAGADPVGIFIGNLQARGIDVDDYLTSQVLTAKRITDVIGMSYRPYTITTFYTAVAERLAQMRIAEVASEAAIPGYELDIGTVTPVLSSGESRPSASSGGATASSGGGGGGGFSTRLGGASASSGGAAALAGGNGIYVGNTPGPRGGINIRNANTGEALPEVTLAIVPYVPPTDIPRAAAADPVAYAAAAPADTNRINILLAAIIYAVLTPATAVAKGGWVAISTLISRLGEKTLPVDDTLLSAMRAGIINSDSQLKYEHMLLQTIAKDIVKQTKVANPQLVTYAADAFSAGQEAILAAYNMFRALLIVKELYPQIDERTLAPKLEMKKAGLESAECNLLKAYVIFVKAIVDKYEARRIFMNEWLSLPESVRKLIVKHEENRSFLSKLFAKIGITSEPKPINISGGQASLTMMYNFEGQHQIGTVTSLITANEMRMINALVVSILNNEAKCIPATLKVEIGRCLRMKEADVPDIMSMDSLNALYDALIEERTTGAAGGGGPAAAAYSRGSNFTKLFSADAAKSRKEAARKEAQEAAIAAAAEEGILGGPVRISGPTKVGMTASSVIGGTVTLPASGVAAAAGAAARVGTGITTVARNFAAGFGSGLQPAIDVIGAASHVLERYGDAKDYAVRAIGNGIFAVYNGAYTLITRIRQRAGGAAGGTPEFDDIGLEPGNVMPGPGVGFAPDNAAAARLEAQQQQQALRERTRGTTLRPPQDPALAAAAAKEKANSTANIASRGKRAREDEDVDDKEEGEGYGGRLTGPLGGVGKPGGGSQGGGYRRRTHKRKHRISRKHKLKSRRRQSTVHRKRKTRRS